jgi:hypothetical protein
LPRGGEQAPPTPSAISGGEHKTAEFASPQLLAALRRQALELTGPLDFRQIVNFRELRRIGVAAACVFLFFTGLSMEWPRHFAILALRMVNPAATVGYPTRTQLTPLNRNPEIVRQGDAVVCKVRADGQFPAEGRLYVRPESGEWRKWTVREGKPQEFAYSVENVFEGFEYYMKIGDARTPVAAVKVVPPPKLAEARVRLSYPPYTGKRPQELNSLSPEVLEGSQVEWHLRFASQVSRVEMVRKNLPPLLLALDPRGLVGRVKAPAVGSFTYQLRFTEAAYGYTFDEGVEHALRVVPDAAPEVELLQPLEDLMGTMQKNVALTFRALDDFGVDQAALACAVNDGPETRMPIASFQGRAVEQFRWKVRGNIPQLKEGDVVSYCVVVRDRYPGQKGPHEARSQVRRLTVVSPEEYRKHVAQELEGLTGEVKKVYQSEREASDQVKILKAGD